MAKLQDSSTSTTDWHPSARFSTPISDKLPELFPFVRRDSSRTTYVIETPETIPNNTGENEEGEKTEIGRVKAECRRNDMEIISSAGVGTKPYPLPAPNSPPIPQSPTHPVIPGSRSTSADKTLKTPRRPAHVRPKQKAGSSCSSTKQDVRHPR